MKRTTHRLLSLAVGALSAAMFASSSTADWTLDDMVQERDGKYVVSHLPTDARFMNPWPAELEQAFQERADWIIRKEAASRPGRGANTFFENEKRQYGGLMLDVLGGHQGNAMAALQAEDAQAGSWHKHTKGIDLFAAFTLKHQMRKYFYFGDLMDPAYRKRMFDAGKIWTERDPMRRPHHAFEGGQGWGPNAKNSWVDVRTTENLFLMTHTSIYLMAEETGNKAVTAEYKNQLTTYVSSLYRIGMGEWDSENYHGHSIAPLHNLYDFAEDPEVKLLAKAALDWLYTAGAVKYYRGGFNGPTKRDYNHVQPFGGSAAALMWTMFGDTPVKPERLESDEVHLITSAYRAPVAVMNLAQKQIELPREIFASKAGYKNVQEGRTDDPPQFLETQYIGHTFQLGTLAGGTRPGSNDVNGFKIMAFDDERGVADIQVVPGPDPLRVGSPQYGEGKVSAANRVAQYRNVAIWLVEDGNSPWLWVMPEKLELETVDGVTFFKGDRTWYAIHPINISAPMRDADRTQTVKLKGKPGKEKPRWPDHHVLSAQGKGGSFSGFAIEIGEEATHGDYAAFKKAVLDKSKLNVDGLGQGVVSYKAADGKTLTMHYAKRLDDFRVIRDGEDHDWAEHARWTYREAGSDDPHTSLVMQRWNGDGTLRVNAGGAMFECTVDKDGSVEFRNEF